MVYKLNANETVEVVIFARDFYSRHSLAIEPNETYQVTCKRKQRWWDWFIPSSPAGYRNILVEWAGLRLETARCFCLCGAFDKDENQLFKIGKSCNIGPQQKKVALYFFANDCKKAYWNNWGKIKVVISRL